MPRHTEPNINYALGAILQPMMGRSSVRWENTQAIAGRPALQPDILISAEGRSPVVIEAEVMPAGNVEPEARDRLGLETTTDGRVIEAAIALRYPEELRVSDSLDADLRQSQLSYCVFTEEVRGSITRFPESGWLDGTVEDIADMVRLVSVPQRAVNEAADALEQGIERAARHLDEVSKTRPYMIAEIANVLGMRNVPQTRRMACAIIANALIFHERFAGMHEDIQPLNLVCGSQVQNPVTKTLVAWNEILSINYYPIFIIAKDILEQLGAREGSWVLEVLRDTAEGVNSKGVDNAHDLTGRIFQRLIADRKYLATFYTLPASAALLARLAVAKMKDVDWGDLEAIRNLRVADFACGTGALLSAVYEQIAARHERAGGDMEALHKVLMERVMYGCDVMPSAAHITAATLAGQEPTVAFEDSQIYTLPYGRQPGGEVKLGSLELLQTSGIEPLINTSKPALRTHRVGEETSAYTVENFPDEGFDLVIMNPPFTSNTAKEAKHIGVFAPAFAAFEGSEDDQRAMSKRMSKLRKGTCYHGHAGMASAFAALARNKLKPGGVIALVLPLTASAASSWSAFRGMMARDFADCTIMSIVSEGRDVSFSSDTDIAECLVIAQRIDRTESTPHRYIFTSLQRRPASFAYSRSIASELAHAMPARSVEDGPYGGTSIMIGEELAGETVATSQGIDGENWGAVRLNDYTLAQTAYALTDSKLWIPGEHVPVNLATTILAEIGSMGLYDLDITGKPPQGPFTKRASSPTATYPSLWNHNARRETRIVCEPDSQLQVRMGMESKAAMVWSTASRAHLTRDFTLGSQPLSVAFTERESIGGRAWPNVNFSEKRFDYAFAIWGNSSMGLISYWWHSSRQQPGRGIMSIRSADSLPVLDFRTLSDEQLLFAELIFDEFRDKELKPAYLADADPNRALLDKRVICDLLGFDTEIYEGVRHLASKWCAEPSVHGGKKRPKGSELII